MRTPTCEDPAKWIAEFVSLREATPSYAQTGHIWRIDRCGLEICVWWRMETGQMHYASQIVSQAQLALLKDVHLRRLVVAGTVRYVRQALACKKMQVMKNIYSNGRLYGL